MSQHHKADKWSAKSPKARARIRARGRIQPCQRCGRLIDLDVDRWDAGHIVDLATGRSDGRTGPEHMGCSRRAGGRQGARVTNKQRRIKPTESDRLPGW